MATCKNCLHACVCFDGDDTTKYYGKEIAAGNVEQLCKNYIPKENLRTNADRMRAMRDEELVAWSHKQIGCGFDFFPCGVVCGGNCESYSKETCDSKILKWLRQPALEG